MNTAASAIPISLLAQVRMVLSLFKLRIGSLIMLTAIVGMMVTPGPRPAWIDLAVLALSTLVASASAGAFNQYVERVSDRRMVRTRERAFASGRMAASAGWLWLMAGMLVASVGTAAWVLNWVSALFVFLGAFIYAVVYTVWLKRRTAWNIVVGGLAGSCAVLAGAAAVQPEIGPQGAILALILFLWTPPHFWSLAIAYRHEYQSAGIPMLPVVMGVRRSARVVLFSTVLLVLASALPLLVGAGPVYLVSAAVGGLYFLAKAFALSRMPDRHTAISCFLASLVHLSLLLIGACIDTLIR